MWPLLLAACCGAAPLFEPTPNNPWDELRRVFYSRQFSNGKVYEHDVSLDGPPWTNWARFYNDANFHGQVVARLDAFLAQPPEQVEKQPPVRRAVLLRDLWPVFDAQTDRELAKSQPAAGRQATLRAKVAHVMRRLTLADAEAAALPDNFRQSVERKSFPAAFDETLPEQGFVPPDLFDETGPWVPFGRGKKELGGLEHAQTAGYRSIFVPLIRVSDRRQETLDYLRTYPKSQKPAPPGTQLALVRRTLLPAASGRVVATPIVESLQLIVTGPQGTPDRPFKFVLDRAELLAGKPGLRMLTRKDPVDAYSLEVGGMFSHDPHQYDTDGEMLVYGRWAGPPGDSSLGHCVACHGRAAERLFANSGSGLKYFAAPTTWAAQAQLIRSRKEARADWKLYRASSD